jgi:hypothetical protein
MAVSAFKSSAVLIQINLSNEGSSVPVLDPDQDTE